MAPLALALSVLIGVSLGFFGGGGSILTVPLLVYVLGLEPKEAIASSLLVVGAASGAGVFQHWRAGTLQLRVGSYFGVAGMTGAFAGGRAASHIDGTLLMLLFAAMMILTALAMWRGRRAPGAAPTEALSIGRLAAQGLGVGLLTGLVGAGGGFLIVPALVLWAALPMPTAVGTSLFIILLNCIAGFSGYVGHVRVDYALVGGIASAAIVGALLGSRLAHRIDPASLRRAFAGFVLAMAVVILIRETDTWIATARAALPGSIQQLAFVLLALAVGIAAGRASIRAGADPRADRPFSEGSGI